MKKNVAGLTALAVATIAGASPALAQSTSANDVELEQLRDQVARERADLDRRLEDLQAQSARLQLLEQRLEQALGDDEAGQPVVVAAAAPPAPAATPSTGVEEVGEAPQDNDRPPEIAAIGQQGSAITRKGQLSADFQTSYARSDRNRAVFRGIEVVESVLVGVFDINESRQDVISASGSLRYGLSNNLEVGVRVPVVARWDTSILAPIAGSTGNDGASTIDNSATGFGLGDIELSMRHQLLPARGGWPYLIGNLQLDIPTGRGPFEVPRDEFGEASKSATGSGFWGVTPGLTAILPSDPAVLFGTLSYTKNFARDVNTVIPPVQILRVDPGDAISFSGGVGFALNPRTSINFGYAHSWGFGTQTQIVAADGSGVPRVETSRDLQIGRFLFGTTYRLNNQTSVNWSVEIGATEDASDVRMVLRLPLALAD